MFDGNLIMKTNVALKVCVVIARENERQRNKERCIAWHCRKKILFLRLSLLWTSFPLLAFNVDGVAVVVEMENESN